MFRLQTGWFRRVFGGILFDSPGFQGRQKNSPHVFGALLIRWWLALCLSVLGGMTATVLCEVDRFLTIKNHICVFFWVFYPFAPYISDSLEFFSANSTSNVGPSLPFFFWDSWFWFCHWFWRTGDGWRTSPPQNLHAVAEIFQISYYRIPMNQIKISWLTCQPGGFCFFVALALAVACFWSVFSLWETPWLILGPPHPNNYKAEFVQWICFAEILCVQSFQHCTKQHLGGFIAWFLYQGYYKTISARCFWI